MSGTDVGKSGHKKDLVSETQPKKQRVAGWFDPTCDPHWEQDAERGTLLLHRVIFFVLEEEEEEKKRHRVLPDN